MRAFAFWAFALVVCAACVDNPPFDVEVDEAFFRCRVEPVLDRSCSALACHGDARRPFHVFTRNRLRLRSADERLDRPLTSAEVAANYDNARFFLAEAAEDSWLLKKPLAQDAGGWFHLGAHLYGDEDIWIATDDPEYQTVLDWARGASEDPSCTYAGTL